MLFAILGFCLQYANAAVVRGLTRAPEVEALADNSHVKRAEKIFFDESNDAHATREELGDELSI